MQPRGNSHYTNTQNRHGKVSSESLSADLETFRNGGGEIEKLGNTPLHRTPHAISLAAAAAAAAAASAAAEPGTSEAGEGCS